MEKQNLITRLNAQSKPTTSQTTSLNSEEVLRVNEFFARLKTIWGAGKYMQTWTTPEDEKFAKREWAQEILKYTPEEINKALENAKVQKTNAEPEFQWPDPSAVLSGCKRYMTAAHREYLPPPEAEKIPESDSRAFFDNLKDKF